MPDALRPGSGGLAAVVACAANDQPAHRVTDQQKVLDSPRPRGQQPVEKPGQVVPAVGDVPACVVTEVDRGVIEARLQPRAVGHVLGGPPVPGDLGLGQPVDEDGQPGSGPRESGCERSGRQVDIASPGPRGHPDGQRGQIGIQLITGYRVECGHRREREVAAPSLARRAAGTQQRGDLAAHGPRRRARAADGEVDAPADRIVDGPDRGVRLVEAAECPVGDGTVHLLDPRNHAAEGTPAQFPGGLQLAWRHRAPPKRRTATRCPVTSGRDVMKITVTGPGDYA